MASRLRLFVCAVVGLSLLALNVRAARVYDDERPPVVLQDARAGHEEALAESDSELTWGRHLYEDDYEEIYEVRQKVDCSLTLTLARCKSSSSLFSCSRSRSFARSLVRTRSTRKAQAKILTTAMT